jgi:hypothetical protein
VGVSSILGGNTGFELRALHLLDRCSTTSGMPPALFALVILETGFHFLPRLTWTSDFMFPAFTGMTDLGHHVQIFPIQMESCKLFGPGCPGTTILSSQVARIIDVSHWCPAGASV